MRIAFTTLSGVGYGGATYFRHLLPAIAQIDRGNEYHIFVSQGHPLMGVIAQPNILFHECVGNNQSALKRLLWEQLVLPGVLRRWKIDILFTAKNSAVFFAPCRTVIAIRNTEPFRYSEYKNYWALNVISWCKWQLTRWSVCKADRIVAVSHYVKELLIERFPSIKDKIEVIYNGNPVAVSQLSDKPDPDEGIPSRFILTASKFVAYANQLNLILGYARLRDCRDDVPPLLLAGGIHDNVYYKRVLSAVEQLRIRPYVQFLGLVPNEKLLALMRRTSLFVFPSTLEACPHTLIEAMACEAVIATSSVPPMPEICDDAAVYFDPYDTDAIADTMERALHQESLRDMLRKRGVERARHFTWENTARDLVALFEHTMRTGSSV